jgi:hypothetical protein
MCDQCCKPEGVLVTRRSIVRKMMLASLAISADLLRTRRTFGQTAAATDTRTGWSRLVTPSPFWNLHGEQDRVLAEFIGRETHLNLDPTGYSVDPSNLDELASYPFVFTNDLAVVSDAKQRFNLQEYLKRGGFLYIDGCLDHRVTRSFSDFLSQHKKLFAELVSGSEVRQLAPDHPIFRAFSPVEENKLSSLAIASDDPRWKDTPQALYGVFSQERMISLISLDHLQCEWLTKPNKIPFCMRQIANIYVYAMTR